MFIRAPMQPTREAVIDWLERAGVVPPYRDVHVGPDGSWRGSGMVAAVKVEVSR
jgi:hypothetical protein